MSHDQRSRPYGRSIHPNDRVIVPQFGAGPVQPPDVQLPVAAGIVGPSAILPADQQVPLTGVYVIPVLPRNRVIQVDFDGRAERRSAPVVPVVYLQLRPEVDHRIPAQPTGRDQPGRRDRACVIIKVSRQRVFQQRPRRRPQFFGYLRPLHLVAGQPHRPDTAGQPRRRRRQRMVGGQPFVPLRQLVVVRELARPELDRIIFRRRVSGHSRQRPYSRQDALVRDGRRQRHTRSL